jgi:hypothetical protein
VASATALRVARLCSDLPSARRAYCGALGPTELATFAGHAGFDRLTFDEPDAAWRLELTCERGTRPDALTRKIGRNRSV